MEDKHVKFISYNGSYPTYCIGTLTLEIDEEQVTFGLHDDNMFDKFWVEGCMLVHDKEDEQYFVNLLPEQFRKYADEIEHIFDEEFEFKSCCGGCE